MATRSGPPAINPAEIPRCIISSVNEKYSGKMPSDCFKGVVLCTLFLVTGLLLLEFSPSPAIAGVPLVIGILLFVAVLIFCRQRMKGWMDTITGKS